MRSVVDPLVRQPISPICTCAYVGGIPSRSDPSAIFGSIVFQTRLRLLRVNGNLQSVPPNNARGTSAG